MNYLSFINRILILSVIVFTFSSCRKKTSPLKLAYPQKVNYESFIVANHLGYFNEDGGNIKVITVTSGINAAEAISLGDAHLAAMGDGPTVILMAQDKNILIVSRYAKGERIHRFIADTSIHVANDLIGKRIGIQMGSSTNGALLNWFDKNNIKLEDVTLVPMDPLNMPEAMKTKQLDAMAGSEPWAVNVEKMCSNAVHELDNLQDENNHFPHVLVANKDAVIDYEKQIRLIISALGKANEFIVNQPDSAAKIATKYIGLSVDEQKVCMNRLTWEINWDETDLKSLEASANFLFKSGKISNKPDIKRFLHILSSEE